jgi:glucosamine 6-phosphate synthetase-like amidotransferase/phosphosugar isomerase protein
MDKLGEAIDKIYGDALKPLNDKMRTMGESAAKEMIGDKADLDQELLKRIKEQEEWLQNAEFISIEEVLIESEQRQESAAKKRARKSNRIAIIGATAATISALTGIALLLLELLK